jgi:hypothetical protein
MIHQLLTPKKKEQNKNKNKNKKRKETKQNKSNQKTKTNKESKTTESTCNARTQKPHTAYIYIFFIGKYQYIKSARGATHVHRTYTKRAHLYKLLIRKRRQNSKNSQVL